MGKEEKNVFVDKKSGALKILINPRLYSQNVVMRASYRFIEDFDVRVEGDPLSKLIVKIMVRDKKNAIELDSVVNDFFAELIHASVEDIQARRYADTRNALIGAALKSMVPDISKTIEKGNVKGKNGEGCGCKG